MQVTRELRRVAGVRVVGGMVREDRHRTEYSGHQWRREKQFRSSKEVKGELLLYMIALTVL